MLNRDIVEESVLRVIEARIRKCFGERIILDKKMREHRWKYHKYVITLDDNNPFQT